MLTLKAKSMILMLRTVQNIVSLKRNSDFGPKSLFRLSETAILAKAYGKALFRLSETMI